MAFANRLEAALQARGFEPLIDRTEIYAFEDWWKRIEALISGADTVVFVLSPDAVASDVAMKEVNYATSLNKRFAPIVCRRVEDKSTPKSLQRLNYIFFDNPDEFDASADQLAKALQTDIGWIRKHTEYGEAARHWVSAARPGGLLLRSPALEEAERWIASRPRGAPEPTAETQTFVADSRRGTTRRRNVLTGSLAAGLLVALILAGLAYWQRGVAVEQQQLANEQRQLAEQQRQRAEDTLAAATKTANSLAFDLAARFKDSTGVPASLVKDILDRARALQEQLVKSGQVTPELKRSEGTALTEISLALKTIGDIAGALAAGEQAKQIFTELLTTNAENLDWQDWLAVSEERIGDALFAQGKLSAALKSYQAHLDILQRLTKSLNDNTDLQRSLAVAYGDIGKVQKARGNLTAALGSYRLS